MTGRLAALVTGAVPPGVYRWRSRAHPGAVRRELARAGWGGYPLAAPVTGTAGFFEGCARALAFPRWVGPGWASLADRLADLSWLPGRGHVLLWERYGTLAAHDGKAWRRAGEALDEALDARERYGASPLFVLLRGEGPPTWPVDGTRIPVLPPDTGTAGSIVGPAGSVAGPAGSVAGTAGSVTGSAGWRRRRAR